MKKLVVITALFLLSLLCLVRAPTYHLWLLAIAVTEFPLIFAAIVTMGILAVIWLQKFQKVFLGISVITLLVFLSPVIRAFRVADKLEERFNKAFGLTTDMNKADSPFDLFRVFFSSEATVTYRRLTYTNTTIHLTLDFYPSQIAGNKPCVIVIHGGSWSSGDSQQLPELNSYLANRGYNVASVNYRMAPKYKSPAPVEDVAQAVTYLRSHANSLKIDTNNLVILGRSAGAQIALLYAYTQHNQGVKGVIDFYGPADMVWGYSAPANPWVMDSRGVMERYLGGTYGAVPQNYKASSPIEYVSPNSVPTLIIHGDNDVLVAPEHSRRLNDKLAQNGVPHYYLRLPWATHGFDYNLNGPGGQLSTYCVERFLALTCHTTYKPE
ncbi:alpha/beta hydrolase [Inquilinus sp. KBS0705]|nr:alpha/beta hydrolase [Inquilinus sp. KBS0705]